MITVDLAAAVICFAAQCYPALVGESTPRGEFELGHYTTDDPMYGGDLLVFKVQGASIFAIHRVLDLPGEQRFARIHSPYARHRISVTDGCVNVTPEVFEKLRDCCSSSPITIK